MTELFLGRFFFRTPFGFGLSVLSGSLDFDQSVLKVLGGRGRGYSLERFLTLRGCSPMETPCLKFQLPVRRFRFVILYPFFRQNLVESRILHLVSSECLISLTSMILFEIKSFSASTCSFLLFLKVLLRLVFL